MNENLSSKFVEFSEIEAEQQQKVFNKLEDEYSYKNYTKLAKDGVKNSKNVMDTLIGNFNWGSEVVDTTAKQQKFIEAFDTLSGKVGKNTAKFKEWNQTLADANSSLQATGDFEQYKTDISGITEELEKLTGISAEDWAKGLTNQLQGTLDVEQIGLNDF